MDCEGVMIEAESYMGGLIDLLKQNFKSRLLYAGLQGSYLRNEADKNSDIDIMVIIDSLTIKDLDLYKSIVAANGNANKSCGFICGKSELVNWNPCEICQLIHTTKDYYGKLTEFVPVYTTEDERNFIKLSLNNLYHEICHRYIHASREKNLEKLPHTYKSVFFILQNLHFQKTGCFIQTKKELLSNLSGEDYAVLYESFKIRNQNKYDFDKSFQMLFQWCQNVIQTI